jgi:hypothetical protein
MGRVAPSAARVAALPRTALHGPLALVRLISVVVAVAALVVPIALARRVERERQTWNLHRALRRQMGRDLDRHHGGGDPFDDVGERHWRPGRRHCARWRNGLDRALGRSPLKLDARAYGDGGGQADSDGGAGYET